MPEIKAVPLTDSESDSGEDEVILERIEVMRELSKHAKPKERFAGGIRIGIDSDIIGQSTSASVSAAEKRGLKELEELERELDLKNTFSRETNRRDEDAEMNKYIEEKIRLERESEKRKRQKLEEIDSDGAHEESDKFTLHSSVIDKVDDILLHSLSKRLASDPSEKSEAMLSSQMLNGIPEVDLGISEEIRTIEATEEAKLKLPFRPSVMID